jgi:hypothetical protein
VADQERKQAEYEAISIADAALRIVDAAILRLQETGKLIVALGENHLTTSHRILAAKVLEGLLDRKIPVTFAIEEQENVIPTFLRDIMDMDISTVPPIMWDVMNTMDNKGHIRAKTILCMDDDLNLSPLEVAVKAGLPVIYADAARKNGDGAVLLDFADQKTRDAAQTLYGHVLDDLKLPAASISGVHIRNHFMLHTCTQTPGFLGDTPHVVLLQAGRAHILGSATEHTVDSRLAQKAGRPHPSMPYNESLAGIAARCSIPFLGACLTSPAGIMNGLESDWHEGTFYFDLPGNQANTPDPDPAATKVKKLGYMNESVAVIAGFMNIARSLSAVAAPKPQI